MKTGRYEPILCFWVVLLFCLLLKDSWGQEAKQNLRWDLQMIEEYDIWHGLPHINYTKDKWPAIKQSLDSVINDYSDSRWADDAALIKACGIYEFEKNTDASLDALQKVIKKYPQAETIVNPYWIPGLGCTLDGIWCLNTTGLVFYDYKGVKHVRPFDRNGVISQQDKEVLAYFNHRREHPVYTITLAKIFAARIQANEGKYEFAISQLTDIIFSNKTKLLTEVMADNSAGKNSDGYYIRKTLRPEFVAFQMLLACYEQKGDNENAIAAADQFQDIVNQKGYWDWIKFLGIIYEKYDRQDKARYQYESARKHIEEDIEFEKERVPRLGFVGQINKNNLSQELKWQKAEIEKKISELSMSERKTSELQNKP